MSNFKVTSYTSTSIDVEWSPIVGATEYKLSWKTGDMTYLPMFLLQLNMGTFFYYVFPSKPSKLSICAPVRRHVCSFKVFICTLCAQKVDRNYGILYAMLCYVFVYLQVIAAFSPVTSTAMFSSIAWKT